MMTAFSRAWWHSPIILVLGTLVPEQYGLQVSLSYIARLHHKQIPAKCSPQSLHFDFQSAVLLALLSSSFYSLSHDWSMFNCLTCRYGIVIYKIYVQESHSWVIQANRKPPKSVKFTILCWATFIAVLVIWSTGCRLGTFQKATWKAFDAYMVISPSFHLSIRYIFITTCHCMPEVVWNLRIPIKDLLSMDAFTFLMSVRGNNN